MMDDAMGKRGSLENCLRGQFADTRCTHRVAGSNGLTQSVGLADLPEGQRRIAALRRSQFNNLNGTEGGW